MFGQKDDSDKQDDSASTDPMQAVSDGAAQLLSTEATTSDDANNNDPPAIASAATAPPTEPSWQHPGDPIETNENDSDQIRDVISPAGGYPSSPNTRIATDSDVPFPHDDTTTEETASLVSATDVTDSELVEIKQKALTELVPLIDKLDQPPEEKFRTIMMMIQASDDQHLVEKAYESAHSIEDEEVRAQALLDIVNEINYFTQPHPES